MTRSKSEATMLTCPGKIPLQESLEIWRTDEQSWLLLVPVSPVPLEVNDWVIRFSKSHKSSLSLKILTAEARGLTDLCDGLGTAITI